MSLHKVLQDIFAIFFGTLRISVVFLRDLPQLVAVEAVPVIGAARRNLPGSVAVCDYCRAA
jgi:hypothetical protein